MSLSDTFNPNGHQTAKPCVKRKAKRSAPFSLRLSADERARLVHEAGAAPLGAYIKAKLLGNEPGSSWKNGYNESFNSKLRDELLNAEIFTMLYEAQVLIERWRRHYNANRPHSSLGYRPPAPETVLPPAFNLAYAALRPAQNDGN